MKLIGNACSKLPKKELPLFSETTPTLSTNERIAEFLDFAIQAKFAYVNKLRRAQPA